MAKRSLKATTEGIALAKRAFERTGWTQDYLAAEVGLSTRQSVWKFFSGRPIERHYFIEICFQLNLDWHDIADIPPPLDASPALADAVGTGQGALPASAIAPVSSVSSPGTVPGQGLAVEGSHVDGDPNRRDRDIHGPGNVDVDVLLDRVRPQWRDRLMAQLGSYQASLDLAQPLDLRTAYTPLHISWDLSHQRWLEVSDLESSSPTPRGFAPQGDRSSASYPSAQQDLANRDRTVLLGKPGSGKTTLLRHLALACAAGDFRPGLFPVFVSLRHWSTATVTGMADAMPPLLPPLQEHIAELWNLAGMGAAETEAVLEAGRGLILLDGLDEVPTSDFGPMVQAIQQFAYHYYQTPIILTCRTAADRIRLQGFAYGELRDLDWAQVKTFAQRWFTAIAPLPNPPEEGGSHPRAQEFLDHLELPSNQAIRHLVKTPILLSLVCSVFHARATFPTQRSKLYKAGLDILLGHWDSARGIRRESPYQQLSTVEKLRLLAQLAAAQFEIGRTFFEKSDVLASISDFLTVRAASTAQGAQIPSDRGEFWEHQWAEAETILTDIVVQHGLLVECARDIYAFSHLTFQEYLTARKWVAALAANAAQGEDLDARDRTQGSPPVGPPVDHLAERLADYLFVSPWRETIGLVVEMLPRADGLLVALKRQVDRVIAHEKALQDILHRLETKVSTPEFRALTIKPAALRAFYLTLFHSRDLNLAMAIDTAVATQPPPPIALDLALARVFNTAQQLLDQPDVKGVLSLSFALDLERQFSLDSELQGAIAQLRAQLPSPEQGREGLLRWCDTQLPQWCADLQDCLQHHRHLVTHWGLNPCELQLLQDYYQANMFLVNCLGNSQTSPALSYQLESELLLSSDAILSRPRSGLSGQADPTDQADQSGQTDQTDMSVAS